MIEAGLAAGFSALLIAAGHWFPWRGLLHRDLHRLEAYVYGVCAIGAPAAALLLQRGDRYAVTVFGVCAAAAGISTVLAKAIDAYTANRNELHDRRNRNA